MCAKPPKKLYAGSTTFRWSLKLIFTQSVVLMSTSKPVNMSFKLQRKVVEPAYTFFGRFSAPLEKRCP